uniref:Cytokinin-O-glucosyltransferase 2 n=3 Tax=Aegilops tauschii subsp. strangulata TaxID=200361 RepID=A0A453SZV8_AEGTS
MSTTTTAQEASNGGGDGRRPHARARRVLMFPLPFQGHINPMLQLADVLHGRGLAVTILHYTGFHNHNTLRPADGVPADVLASGNVIAMIVAMNTAMEASVAFRDVLAAESMLAGEGKPRAACLVIDSNLFGAQKAAEELGLPTIALRPGSAACFNCFLAYPMLHQNGYLPPKESQLDMPVKELPPLRVRDLFLSSRADHEMLSKFLAKATHAARSYSALVINTFEALETDELQKIRGEIGMCTTKRHGREEQQCASARGSHLHRVAGHADHGVGVVRERWEPGVHGLRRALGGGVGVGQQRPAVPMGRPAGPRAGIGRTMSTGRVRRYDEGQGQGDPMGPAARGAGPPCGGRVVDPQRVELDARECSRGLPDDLQASVRGPDDERDIRGCGVGRRL